MIVLHIHHIIPKHMGGTDDPSNLIELTVEEHSEAHRILFEQFGRKEDELAWKGLAGYVKNKEINYLKNKIGGYKSKGRIKSTEECEKLSASWTIERKQKLSKLSKKRFTGKPKSKEHIQKMKAPKLKKSVEKMIETQRKNCLGGKSVITPMGIFNSLYECSRQTGINSRTLKYRATKQIMGYKFMDKRVL